MTPTSPRPPTDRREQPDLLMMRPIRYLCRSHQRCVITERSMMSSADLWITARAPRAGPRRPAPPRRAAAGRWELPIACVLHQRPTDPTHQSDRPDIIQSHQSDLPDISQSHQSDRPDISQSRDPNEEKPVHRADSVDLSVSTVHVQSWCSVTTVAVTAAAPGPPLSQPLSPGCCRRHAAIVIVINNALSLTCTACNAADVAYVAAAVTAL